MSTLVITTVEKMELVSYITFFLIISLCHDSNCHNATYCQITEFSQVDKVLQSCSQVTVANLTVPAKKTLLLHLRDGTQLRFEGTVRFEYAEWAGPLMKIQGSHIKVTASKESVLDGQGALYWDSLGGNGGKEKPVFVRVEVTNSLIENLNILNCPVWCIGIRHSNDLTIKGWTVDVSDGDKNNFTGHNTDGFDITDCHNVLIENCTVKNQDDCVAINKGSNIVVSNMYCSGGHGLSLTVGSSLTDFSRNVVSDVIFKNSVVDQSANGIHLKTHADSGPGLIRNISYENIHLSDITNFGINIQQDYENGEATGKPKGNIPIRGFVLSNITGTMKSFRGSPTLAVNILCGTGGCADWTWKNVVIKGAQNKSSCNFTPTGYSC